MKILTLYNHKGGVSKTTTTFNIVHLLQEQGFKVLVVDADPQCNITELLIGDLISELDIEIQKTGKDNDLPGTTLLDILTPRISGERPEVSTNIDVIKVKENLDLIRGNVQLSNIEDALAEAHIQRFSTKIHEKRTYIAISDFLRRFGSEKQYDYIFIDVGPSSGALTRNCFLACDAFFIPVAPDRFNIQAIKTLSTIIERWISDHDKIIDDFQALGLNINVGKPIFLGAIPQHYKLLKGKPKPGYKLWMERLPKTVNDFLLPQLRKFSTPQLDLTNGLSIERICTESIPDFQSLASLMQEYCVPVFRIQQDMTAAISETSKWGGATWKDAQRRMDDYKEKFSSIVERIKKLS
ncbi:MULTISPECIES: ParA family protein [Sphingobacterium]|uniref:ParA family protein n=1 Tax=Sphingobacterium TaxID=28453 RepID=UPI0008A3BB46|nr:MULTISPECIES: AAA family ATPase [Sphingobacterium]OFV11840.1 chromosome partitioning protein [Sphingobacterium sp. HMSC13C05]HAF32590.1 chromosome partitioning protein [Sphingobacterium sp.]HAL54066.1 chromosome partitioning protein [Sphingobacterium sp.]HBX63300.1 chromosome partitioning protein [Flavobacteriaceae bacterium]